MEWVYVRGIWDGYMAGLHWRSIWLCYIEGYKRGVYEMGLWEGYTSFCSFELF